MKRATGPALPANVSRHTTDSDPVNATPASMTAATARSQRQSRRAALQASAGQSQIVKRRRTGLPASSGMQFSATSAGVPDAAAAASVPLAEPPDSPTASDHLSALPGEIVTAITSHFPLGAREPSRLAMTGTALHGSVKHRALADKLFRLTFRAGLTELIEIIGAARPLPDELKNYVLQHATRRLTALCPGSPCLAMQFNALRSAIASIGQEPCRATAMLTLANQFYDDHFMQLPATPELEHFFKAFRTDIDSLQDADHRQMVISRWASGLRMLRDPDERWQQWQALFASDRTQPTRANLVVSLSFALMSLPPVAERIGAIDAIVAEAEALPARAQADLVAPVLSALGQEPVNQVQREDRFFLLWQRALSLPATEKEASLSQLVSRISLLRTTQRFSSMRNFVAQMNRLGFARGTDLMCATIAAIPQLADGGERESMLSACSQALSQVPSEKVIAPLCGLIDSLPFLTGDALRAGWFAALSCTVIALSLAQQEAPISHLLSVFTSLSAGASRSEALTKLMLLIQLAPAQERVVNLCTLLTTLDQTTPPTDLSTVFRWAQRTAREVSADQAYGIISAMSRALPAFRTQEILNVGIQALQQESANLPLEHAVFASAQIHDLMIDAANLLHAEMTYLPMNRFVGRFEDLLKAACRGLDPPTPPVIGAIVGVVDLAFRNQDPCRHELSQRCRAAIPPFFLPLLDRAVQMPA